MKKSIGLKDVAKHAGVGLGTASRVLNNHPSVTEETRKIVLEAIKELNYQPNAIARSLKIKTTSTIGVIIPDITSAYFPDIVRGIEDVANDKEYNIMLFNTDLDSDKEKVALNMLHEKKVDGLIFISNTICSETRDKFLDMDIPVVLIATKDDENLFPSITIDNEGAAYEAVNFLSSLGHKSISMISGHFDDPNSGVPRIKGYKKALSANNISLEHNYIYEGDFTYKSGYESMQKLLNLKNRPTAVFVASDIMAIGASRAALESGLKIPEDISIFGFDGVEAAEFFYPAVSTIEQPRYTMGAEGMRLLLKLMNKEAIEEINIVMKHKLINRESCKRL
jgi:LacI family transcriptional regulator